MSEALADLHVHLYGAIGPEDFLAYTRGREVDWALYEEAYERAYGAPSPAQELLARRLRGEAALEAAWRDVFVFGDRDAGNFARFQAKFNLLIAGSAFRRLEDSANLEELLGELRFYTGRILRSQREQGIGYAEHRMLFGPETPPEVARAALESILADFVAERHTTARLALSLPRSDPWPYWDLAQELALGPHGEAFTGVDFCFIEEGHPPKAQAGFFRAVHAFNGAHRHRALAILYHVGESFEDKSLESAVRWVHESAELGAHRLGHAIALGVDPDAYGVHLRSETVSERLDQIAYDLRHAGALESYGLRIDRDGLERERAAYEARPEADPLEIAYDDRRLADLRLRQDFAMDRVREIGSVVEVCPTSNLRIGGIGDARHHPVHRFAERGVPFVVASDDPGIFGTTLREELDWVGGQLALDVAGLDSLGQRAWQHRSEVVAGRSEES